MPSRLGGRVADIASCQPLLPGVPLERARQWHAYRGVDCVAPKPGQPHVRLLRQSQRVDRSCACRAAADTTGWRPAGGK